MAHYATHARRLIIGVCEAHPTGAQSLVDLVTLVLVDDDADFFLDDSDPTKQQHRHKQLLLAMRVVLGEYEERRLTAPLRESLIAEGNFTYAFADNAAEPDDIRDRLARYRQARRVMVLASEMGDAEFESLMGKLMVAIGLNGVTVTKSSKDNGIDFLGRLPVAPKGLDPVGLSPLFRLAGGVSFVVFGQVKRYALDTIVGREPVAQLVGDWQGWANGWSANTLADHQSAAMTLVAFKAADPVLTVLATTSSFTAGAKSTSADLGVILLDGEQLSQLLCEVRIGVEKVKDFEYETSDTILSAAAQT